MCDKRPLHQLLRRHKRCTERTLAEWQAIPSGEPAVMHGNQVRPQASRPGEALLSPRSAAQKEAENEGALILATLLERRQSVRPSGSSSSESDKDVPASPTSTASDSAPEVFKEDKDGDNYAAGGSKKRGPQKCRRCGLPRKGHKCLALMSEMDVSRLAGLKRKPSTGDLNDGQHQGMPFPKRMAGGYPVMMRKENTPPQMPPPGPGAVNMESFLGTISARYGINRAELDQLYRDCCVQWRPIQPVSSMGSMHGVGQTVVAVSSAGGMVRPMGGPSLVAVSLPSQQPQRV